MKRIPRRWANNLLDTRKTTMRNQQGKGAQKNRRSQRSRKVSQQMAVVDEDAQQEAIQAHLDALENDNDFIDVEDTDDEFMVDSEEEIEIGPKKRKKNTRAKRKTRSMAERRGAKNFATLLDEAELERLGDGVPNYLTAAAGPPKFSAKRKFCSVCGNMSPYSCARCGSTFCCRRCYSIHTDTRCLKFLA